MQKTIKWNDLLLTGKNRLARSISMKQRTNYEDNTFKMQKIRSDRDFSTSHRDTLRLIS